MHHTQLPNRLFLQLEASTYMTGVIKPIRTLKKIDFRNWFGWLSFGVWFPRLIFQIVLEFLFGLRPKSTKIDDFRNWNWKARVRHFQFYPSVISTIFFLAQLLCLYCDGIWEMAVWTSLLKRSRQSFGTGLCLTGIGQSWKIAWPTVYLTRWEQRTEKPTAPPNWWGQAVYQHDANHAE